MHRVTLIAALVLTLALAPAAAADVHLPSEPMSAPRKPLPSTPASLP